MATPQSTFCAKCGALLTPGNLFCENCGQPLTPAAPPNPAQYYPPRPQSASGQNVPSTPPPGYYPPPPQAGRPVAPPPSAVKRNPLRIIFSIAGMMISCCLLMVSLVTFINGSGGLKGLAPYLPSFLTDLQSQAVAMVYGTSTPEPSSVITPNNQTTTAPAAKMPVQSTPKLSSSLISTPTSAFGIGSIQISKIDGMKLLYVPAGEFQMGSTDVQFQAAVASCIKESGAGPGDETTNNGCMNSYQDEKPAHTVYLDAFWIDKSEVTNAMYAMCVGAGDCQTPHSAVNGNTQYYGISQYASYPVTGVEWNLADAYCKWAGRKLPTEAQWEKAARGTDGRIYPWGNQDPAGSQLNDAGDMTQVGSYPAGASPFGALDMLGSVNEWVADWYSESYYSSSPSRNPMGPSSGSERVVRGGAWTVNNGSAARSASRIGNDPATWDSNLGFRCSINAAP
ncbi:MAG: SUMF1/EgtB/PvdO family nonheme iron enzyme [Anaerolineaceae bacterium]|nr:SUMF1/EgtB/PvdO family nonheme iron enzyme [Anaerolineaceae bacterium]